MSTAKAYHKNIDIITESMYKKRICTTIEIEQLASFIVYSVAKMQFEAY
jgi:hypothetical protein